MIAPNFRLSLDQFLRVVSAPRDRGLSTGASSETKQKRRGTLIRRTFPLIWASVLDPEPGGRPLAWEGPRGSGLRALPRDAC